MILMLFHLFCMFDDYWRINCETRILLEKGLSRHHISEDQQFAENSLEFLFCQTPEAAKRGGKGGPPWAHTIPCRGAAPLPGAPPRGVVAQAHLSRCPFTYFIPQKP